jgi:hypothetical protein
MMVSYPARAAAARSDSGEAPMRVFWPVVASLTLVVLLVQFFTQYFAPHRFGGLRYTPSGDDFWTLAAIGSVFVTNAILLVATFVAVRRWRTPLGTFTVMYALVAVGVTGMFEFQVPLHIPAMAIAGLVTDVLAGRLRPSPDRRGQALVFGSVVPLVTWGLWLGAIHLTGGVRWSIDLWAGIVYLAVLEGLGLAVLAFPRASAVVEVVPRRDIADEPLYSKDQV